MFNKIKNYINNDDFKLIIFKNSIYIENYIKIISLENNRISFIIPDGRLIIKGENLTLNRIMKEEVLINGNLISIEVDHDK